MKSGGKLLYLPLHAPGGTQTILKIELNITFI